MEALMRTAVVGAGSWGTALAAHLTRAGHRVTLWAREPEVAAGITENHSNPLFLPDVKLPEALEATAELDRAVAGAEAVLFVVPVQFARGVLGELRTCWPAEATFVSASKGVEVDTLFRMDELVGQLLHIPRERFTALSGPSFAREVVAGQPTAVVLAGHDKARVTELQAAFSTRELRLYSSSDVVGVELAGALKNVIALAAGLTTGMGLGHNALAALLTRGLHEITRLGVHLGGREETFRGLAGMGDLVLTCTGALSRNRRAGERLAHGERLADLLAGREVAEGVPTTRAAVALAALHAVELPIAATVQAILEGTLAPAEAVGRLMVRELKAEAVL
jgi:glycerol-3-phosphate dehydrogenase (NAD(P)+)